MEDIYKLKYDNLEQKVWMEHPDAIYNNDQHQIVKLPYIFGTVINRKFSEMDIFLDTNAISDEIKLKIEMNKLESIKKVLEGERIMIVKTPFDFILGEYIEKINYLIEKITDNHHRTNFDLLSKIILRD